MSVSKFRSTDIEFRAGYYEWNLYINGDLIYSFGEDISELIEDNMKRSDLESIAELYVDGMIENIEEMSDKDITFIKDNKEIILEIISNVWAYHFCINE